jgi:hypothetical protein
LLLGENKLKFIFIMITLEEIIFYLVSLKNTLKNFSKMQIKFLINANHFSLKKLLFAFLVQTGILKTVLELILSCIILWKKI